MSDEFQLRKDIDRFKHFLDELDRLYNENGVTSSSLSDLLSRYYDKSEVDVVTTKLYDDITSLDTNLDTLRANLVSFNQKLITFNGDTETLATDLSTLGNNLNSVLGDISTITADLSTLSDNFDTLDGNFITLDSSLTGLSHTVDGLDSDLITLDNKVNGLSTTIGDANSGMVKELNDVSSSLIGTDGDLRNLISDLETLAEYMTDFEGSLSDFQQELIDNNVELDTISLQSNIVKLFGALSSVKNDVSTVEEDIYGANGTSANPSSGSVLANLSDVQDTIGDANSGLVKELNDTSNAIDNVETDLYGTGTSANPQSGSVKANINQAQTNITNTQNTLYGGSGYSTSNPSSNSVMGQMGTVQEDMYGSNKDPSNPQSGSLVSDLSTAQGNINTIRNTDIPAVQGDISDVQDIMYGANGSVQNPETGSLLDNVDTVQGNISDVQTDIGTVNPTVDGDLQTQLTYLPSYIDRLSVSNSSTYSDNGNVSNLPQPTTAYIIIRFSELAKKVMRDRNSIGFNIYITDPDNQVTNLPILIYAQNSPSQYSTSFNFSKYGHYIISCEHLKYSFYVGKPLWERYVGTAISFTNMDNYSSEYTVMLEVYGDMITFSGIGKLTTAVSANQNIQIATVSPAPRHTVVTPWVGNNKQGFIQIGTDGKVSLYNRSGSTVSLSVNDYFAFNCTYRRVL